MELLENCFDFYINSMECFDPHGKELTAILSKGLDGLEDALLVYANYAEHHAFEAGYRFGLVAETLRINHLGPQDVYVKGKEVPNDGVCETSSPSLRET